MTIPTPHFVYLPTRIWAELEKHGVSTFGKIRFMLCMKIEDKKQYFSTGKGQDGSLYLIFLEDDHPPTPVWETLNGTMIIHVYGRALIAGRSPQQVVLSVERTLYFTDETDAVHVAMQDPDPTGKDWGVMRLLQIGLGQ